MLPRNTNSGLSAEFRDFLNTQIHLPEYDAIRSRLHKIARARYVMITWNSVMYDAKLVGVHFEPDGLALFRVRYIGFGGFYDEYEDNVPLSRIFVRSDRYVRENYHGYRG